MFALTLSSTGQASFKMIGPKQHKIMLNFILSKLDMLQNYDQECELWKWMGGKGRGGGAKNPPDLNPTQFILDCLYISGNGTFLCCFSKSSSSKVHFLPQDIILVQK